MFDVAPTEFMLVAVIALVVIGPKELPRVLRMIGQWVGKARGIARQFRSGFDEMMRESELAEMEKKWAEENAKIMAEFPSEDVVAVKEPTGEPKSELKSEPNSEHGA
jgi:sec-independent protein translocase protein TatB